MRISLCHSCLSKSSETSYYFLGKDAHRPCGLSPTCPPGPRSPVTGWGEGRGGSEVGDGCLPPSTQGGFGKEVFQAGREPEGAQNWGEDLGHEMCTADTGLAPLSFRDSPSQLSCPLPPPLRPLLSAPSPAVLAAGHHSGACYPESSPDRTITPSAGTRSVSFTVSPNVG